MQLIDTHCHIHFEAYKDDMLEVITRAKEAGVFMITVGTQTTTSAYAIEVAKAHEGVWATVGLHPNHTVKQTFVDPNEVPEHAKVKTRAEIFDADYYRPLANEEVCVAIGECGLDYYRIPEGVSKEEVIATQKEMVRAHFDLATEVNKPVVIHCRDAHDDQIEIIKEYKDAGKLQANGVVHCFTGALDEAQRYIELGFYISFTGILTFTDKKHKDTLTPLQKVAKALPLDRILVETDSPYLTPAPNRGKRNEPINVRDVATYLAKIREIDLDEVARVTTENAKRLFGL